MDLSRRGFLRSTGLAWAGLMWRGFDVPKPDDPADDAADASGGTDHWDDSVLGRVLLNVMTVYSEPTWRSRHTGYYVYDDVVEVKGAVEGEGLYPSNPTWVEIDGGYLYTSWLQPVNQEPPNPTERITSKGAWGQVSVPKTSARSGPGDNHYEREVMVYETTHHIIGVENDYYHIQGVYGGDYWLKAADVRVIKPEEITPISPDVPPEDKRIDISLREQRLTAYEGDEAVFTHLVATGMPETGTPMGEYYMRLKRLGQRMTGGASDTHYNLPGIPWVSYFTPTYAATHGCYWHNDYGRRHSAGCVNMPSKAAKWIFRWTTPVYDYYALTVVPDEANGQPGTRVTVRW